RRVGGARGRGGHRYRGPVRPHGIPPRRIRDLGARPARAAGTSRPPRDGAAAPPHEPAAGRPARRVPTLPGAQVPAVAWDPDSPKWQMRKGGSRWLAMKPEEPLESYLTVAEAAKLLRMTSGTIYNWLYRRKIPSVKVGGRVLLASSSLQAWLRRRERQE